MHVYKKGMEVGKTQSFDTDVTLDSGAGFIARVIPKQGKPQDCPSQLKGKRHQVQVKGPAEVILTQADGSVKPLE